MTERYGIVPGEDHYMCIVDLVSHALSNDRVVEWIENSPFGFSKRVWENLIGNCVIHGNAESLEKVEKHLMELDYPE
uniref:Uncharacterized protein n=1 Tax=Arundo donax TaxID=35708 RepID=A0A0A8ZJV8_ARUDO